MGKTKVGWIIHVFALLHAAVAFVCRLGSVEDELLLTILTIAMTLLICVRRVFSAEFAAASVIVANIIGFLLGNATAVMLSRVIHSDMAIHALATALTTEILGWSIVAFSKLLHQGQREQGTLSSKFYKWIILAAGAMVAMRIGILLLVSGKFYESGSMLVPATKLFSNSFSIIPLICLNIIYIRYSSRFNKRLSTPWVVATLAAFMVVAAFIGSGLSVMGLSFKLSVSSWEEFFGIYIVALIAQLTIYCIVYMVNYTISTGDRMQKEKEKKHIAQYRYQKLKR